MAFCQKCGAELAEGAAFCASCGTAVGTAGTGRKQEYMGVIKKCPNCGEIIPNGLVTKCPSCGFELNKSEISKGIKDFTDALRRADSFTEKINIVGNYVVPNNKEDVTEFLVFADAQCQAIINGAERTGNPSFSESKLLDVWNSKCEQTINKSIAIFSTDSSFCSFLNEQKKLVEPRTKRLKAVSNKRQTKGTIKTAMKILVPVAVVAAIVLFIVDSQVGLFIKIPSETFIPVNQITLGGKWARFYHIAGDTMRLEPTNDFSEDGYFLNVEFTLVCDKSLNDAVDEAIEKRLKEKKWDIKDCRVDKKEQIFVVEINGEVTGEKMMPSAALASAKPGEEIRCAVKLRQIGWNTKKGKTLKKFIIGYLNATVWSMTLDNDIWRTYEADIWYRPTESTELIKINDL